MSNCHVAPPSRRWSLAVAASLASLLILTHCESNPFEIQSHSASWTLGTVQTPALAVEHQTVTPVHGFSRTLYIGFPPGIETRESVTLLKFTDPDTEAVALATGHTSFCSDAPSTILWFPISGSTSSRWRVMIVSGHGLRPIPV